MGAFQKHLWALKSKSSKTFTCKKREPLKFHTKYRTHAWFLYNIEILRALRFKSSYAFLKRPPAIVVSMDITTWVVQGSLQWALGPDSQRVYELIIQIWSKSMLIYLPKPVIRSGHNFAQIIAWCQTGNKSLFKIVMVCLFDTYMPHLALTH